MGSARDFTIALPYFMNTTVKEAVFLGFSTWIFSLALVYALIPTFQMQKEFENSIGTDGTVYEIDVNIPDVPSFTGSEVIASIYKLDFDNVTVKVNETVFSKTTDLFKNQNIINENQKYKQNITFNPDGKVQEIIYTSF